MSKALRKPDRRAPNGPTAPNIVAVPTTGQPRQDLYHDHEDVDRLVSRIRHRQ